MYTKNLRPPIPVTNIIDDPKESILDILGIPMKNEEMQATLSSIGEKKGLLEFL